MQGGLFFPLFSPRFCVPLEIWVFFSLLSGRFSLSLSRSRTNIVLGLFTHWPFFHARRLTRPLPLAFHENPHIPLFRLSGLTAPFWPPRFFQTFDPQHPVSYDPFLTERIVNSFPLHPVFPDFISNPLDKIPSKDRTTTMPSFGYFFLLGDKGSC